MFAFMPSVPRGEPRSLIDRVYGPRYYTVDDDGTPVGTFDVNAWARWMDRSESRQDRELLHHVMADGVTVDTGFIGIDMKYPDAGPPLLWETMISGGPHDGYQRRYTSLDEARSGHAETLDMVNGNGGDGRVAE